MQLRGNEAKVPIQKPLCRLCECPTSDGHVLASQVDRLKLRKWAMQIMNLTEGDENLPEVVEKDALICYFCIWQAEFGDESGDEAVAWWPKNLDLEENAKVLRENYSVGEVEQCWVQLGEVELAKCEKEIPKKGKAVSGVCVYCGKRVVRLMDHVKAMHKEAIKCGIRGCTTFFYTEEEKEQHMQNEFHEKPHRPRRETKKICCIYCVNDNIFFSFASRRNHMKRFHPELTMACTYYGCDEFFKSKSEMSIHINSSHKKSVNRDLYLCTHCEYFTAHRHLLRKHEESKHMPKIFKCGSCDAKFGSKWVVKVHSSKVHTFEKCKSCGQDVALGFVARHRKPKSCSNCKLRFKCKGLERMHRKSCYQTFSRCKECGKQFAVPHLLNKHVKGVHANRLSCEHCDFSAFSNSNMVAHMQRRHFPKTIKCLECSKLFASEMLLDTHKSKTHAFLRCAECAQEIRFFNMPTHRTSKSCRRCECTFKCRGLLEKHINSCVQTKSTDFYCDKCPKFYRKKQYLYIHMKKKHIVK
ncbi:Hypothetical predicted protein [Cloeon dipterum]|uniref:C2H2-type domain-containing protein n=1 Tax=Cloeon dipterum TaxID=197152 RepID=A0A8S1D687_9INSE|nr:Hypothetical predicted protein [Cloeon dipterum]